MMNNEFDKTASPGGDFISKTAAGAPVEQPPRTAPADATSPGRATELPTDADHPSLGVSGSRRLRRWSVAELLAQAVARPASSGLAH